MNNDERRAYILQLDDELLLGGVMLSEWATFLIRDADEAFSNGAHLATILVAHAAIECHLRYENPGVKNKKVGSFELIEQALLSDYLKAELHKLRKYRNRWVHVNDPHDEDILDRPEYYEAEIEEMAILAVTLLRQVIYQDQWS